MMSRPPDHMYEVSKRLSEVMNDIGMNEKLVMKRRRMMTLVQHILRVVSNQEGKTSYIFGSQSEGSTTLGLKSDMDILIMTGTVNVIQNMSEWKPRVVNLKMIQNDNISPGYCYLQYNKHDLSLPGYVNDIDCRIMEHCADREGRSMLLKNTYLTHTYPDNQLYNLLHAKLHGPAFRIYEVPVNIDIVTSFYCKSSPHQVTSWLQKQRGCKWPTEDVLEQCRNVGCFMVPVCGKKSYIPKLEWRISTSLQERYVMFSLNITQLRCYVLMKIILKTYIDPHVEDVMSSFICKNVLLYCIANSLHDWHTGNLLSYLQLCLFLLKERVEQRNCPHFMIPENNLLTGCMTNTQRGKLLDIINNLMKNDVQFLFDIQIDDLGTRLMMKLNMISYMPNVLPGLLIYPTISSDLMFRIAMTLSKSINVVLKKIAQGNLEMALQHLRRTILNLRRVKREPGDFYLRTASELLTPLVSSTLGSVMTSAKIDTHTNISYQAFSYLEAGKESDALSGRLKLVSVLYCIGDMERAERELRIIEAQCNISKLQTVCDCFIMPTDLKSEYTYARVDYNEKVRMFHLALCTRFLQCEINCVPRELRYETLNICIEEERAMRIYLYPKWVALILVDSIPYFYFLQYKTYGHLQRRTEQLKALFNLLHSINIETRLGHKETALNLLGQCMEQENRQTEALKCYLYSLKCRERNIVARFLVCIQLFKLWKQDNLQ